jgi:murein DD-endopeptidase MepM/ murein hydrolase activator NlpD
MLQSTETKKASLIQKLNQSVPRHVLLLGVLLLAAIIFLGQFPKPPVSSAQVPPTAAAIPPAVGNLPTALPRPTVAQPIAALTTTPSIWPARGTITSVFGWRVSPFGDGNELHAGIDIAYTMGAPVVATADGEVVMSGSSGGYGNLVQLNHGNGISTLYGHNSQLIVKVGQTVKKGQVIAYAGSTGKSTGPHVHYEVRVNNNPVDPMKYLVQY